jgi:glycosyltransferase involved in cell wall biosynthesis
MNAKLKNVLVLHRGGVNGVRGTEICLSQSIEVLNKAGYVVSIARNLPIFDHLISDHINGEIIEFDFPELYLGKLTSFLSIRKWLTQLKGLINIAKRLQPALLYSSGGLPCQLSVAAGKLLNIPVLCHFHHPASKKHYQSWLIKQADYRIYPSRFTMQDVREQIGCGGEVIYNGIDTDVFISSATRDHSWRNNLGIPSDAVVVAQVGALTSNKRPEFLLDAFNSALTQCPQLYLCLIGKGAAENQLRAEITALGLSKHALVTGYVEAILPFYQHVIDINALVSSEEGLGISVLEGSACSLPAIAADCTGLRECVIQGITGFRFPTHDKDELVTLLVKLGHDAQLRSTLGAAGRQNVVDNFNLHNYQKAILHAVDTVLEKHPTR